MNSTRESTPNRLVILAFVIGLLVAIVFFGAIIRLAWSPAEPVAQSDKKPQEAAANGPDGTSQQAQGEFSTPDEPGPSAKTADAQNAENNAAENKTAENNVAEKASDPKLANEEEKPVWVDQWSAEPTAWRDGAMDRFDTAQSLPLIGDLKEWFGTAPGSPPPALRTTNTSLGRCAAFKGIVELKPEFDAPGALRLDLQSIAGLRIHVFHGASGVTFMRYDNHSWAAYRTSRSKDAPKPDRLRLTGTDDGRARRTSLGYGPFELCLLEDEVVLSRGDVVIVRAPIDGVAEDVFLEGSSAVQGVSIRRLSDHPPQDGPRRQVETMSLAKLSWDSKLDPKAKLSLDGEKPIELSAKAAATPSRAWAIAGDLGLHLVDFELENISPGSGVYLGEKGKPGVVLRFYRNSHNGETHAVFRGDQAHEFNTGGYDKRTAAVVGDKAWVRLAAGGGYVRAWLSVDGVHWGYAGGQNNPSRRIDSIGIECVSQASDAHLTLRQLRLIPLSGLTKLADEDLLGQVTACSQPNSTVWHQETLATLPADISLGEWRLASSIKSLQRWSTTGFTEELLQNSLQEAMRKKRPLDRLLSAFDDAGLVFPVNANPTAVDSYQKLYEQAAILYAPEQDEAYDLALHRLLRASILSPHYVPTPSQEWLRDTIVRRVFERHWNSLLGLSANIRFYKWESRAPLLPWAETLAIRQTHMAGDAVQDAETPTARRGGPRGGARSRWRPVVVEEVDREAYNRLSELSAALAGGNLPDAAEIVASIRPDDVAGVAPVENDGYLLQSMRAALHDVWQVRPEIEDVLREKYLPVGELRLQQAVDAADPEAARIIAMQFGRLAPSAKASLWLGDRNLSTGRFQQAVADYARAARHKEIAPELASRLSLAQAMIGQLRDETPQGVVEFADASFTADEFAALLKSIAETRKLNESARLPLRPTDFEVHFAAKMDGQIGKAPQQAIARDSHKYCPEWPIRQLAYSRHGDTVYVSNRFQIAAYSLTEGERKWVSENSLGEPLRSQDWFLTKTKPLISGDAVYGRFLYGTGPRLARLDRNDGKVVWATANDSSRYIISDPMLMDGKLLALVLIRGQQQSQLHLSEFDPETGVMRRGPRILDVTDRWWRKRYCAVRPLAEGIVFTLGGAVAYSDYSGHLQWIRRDAQAPVDLEPTWTQQSFEPPLEVDGHIVVAQPSSRAVSCLVLGSGRVAWRKCFTNLLGVWYADSERVLLRTTDGLVAVSMKSGETEWQFDEPNLLTARAFQDGRAILVRGLPYQERQTKRQPQVIWLDLKSGKLSNAALLAELADSSPFLGPFIIGPKDVWTFYSNGRNDADLDMLRLEPKDDAQPTAAIEADRWSNATIEASVNLTRKFPQWRLLAASTTRPQGVARQALGSRDVPAYQLASGAPILLAGRIPKGSQRLRVRLGDKGNVTWKVEVLRGDEKISEETRESVRRLDRSFEFEAKLDDSGSEWLLLRITHVSGDSELYVDRLEFEQG